MRQQEHLIEAAGGRGVAFAAKNTLLASVIARREVRKCALEYKLARFFIWDGEFLSVFGNWV